MDKNFADLMKGSYDVAIKKLPVGGYSATFKNFKEMLTEIAALEAAVKYFKPKRSDFGDSKEDVKQWNDEIKYWKDSKLLLDYIKTAKTVKTTIY